MVRCLIKQTIRNHFAQDAKFRSNGAIEYETGTLLMPSLKRHNVDYSYNESYIHYILDDVYKLLKENILKKKIRKSKNSPKENTININDGIIDFVWDASIRAHEIKLKI